MERGFFGFNRKYNGIKNKKQARNINMSSLSAGHLMAKRQKVPKKQSACSCS